MRDLNRAKAAVVFFTERYKGKVAHRYLEKEEPCPALQCTAENHQTIIRRPLHEKIQMAFQQIGVMALLFLMVFALYNDLTRIFG